MQMQDKRRFGELHNVCFVEENYPCDIFNFLEIFSSTQFRITETREFPPDTKPENFLEYQNISNEVKQRFERNVSPIQSQNYNGIAISLFTNPYIGDWYLKEIKDSSIVGYHNAIPRSGLWRWQESIYNLKYKEAEIVYCIMKKLSKYYEQNNKFEIELNKYKAFFDGTLEEFLECLLNEYEDFYFFTNLGSHYYYMNKIEGYDGLRKRLIEMVNNLSVPPAPKGIEVGKKKTTKNITKQDVEIRDLFDGFTKKQTQANALHSILKELGISKDNMNDYKKEQDRVRKVLERLGKWKKKSDKKATEIVQ
jgi:hypothetical protein